MVRVTALHASALLGAPDRARRRDWLKEVSAIALASVLGCRPVSRDSGRDLPDRGGVGPYVAVDTETGMAAVLGMSLETLTNVAPHARRENMLEGSRPIVAVWGDGMIMKRAGGLAHDNVELGWATTPVLDAVVEAFDAIRTASCYDDIAPCGAHTVTYAAVGQEMATLTTIHQPVLKKLLSMSGAQLEQGISDVTRSLYGGVDLCADRASFVRAWVRTQLVLRRLGEQIAVAGGRVVAPARRFVLQG